MKAISFILFFIFLSLPVASDANIGCRTYFDPTAVKHLAKYPERPGSKIMIEYLKFLTKANSVEVGNLEKLLKFFEVEESLKYPYAALPYLNSLQYSYALTLPAVSDFYLTETERREMVAFLRRSIYYLKQAELQAFLKNRPLLAEAGQTPAVSVVYRHENGRSVLRISINELKSFFISSRDDLPPPAILISQFVDSLDEMSASKDSLLPLIVRGHPPGALYRQEGPKDRSFRQQDLNLPDDATYYYFVQETKFEFDAAAESETIEKVETSTDFR